MRHLLPLACLVLPSALAAETDPAVKNTEHPRSLTVYSENDKYFAGTDQAYTNGLKISYLSRNLKDLERGSVPAPSATFADVLGKLLPSGEAYRAGFSLGQNIYTPVDTQTTAYQPDDRPYAAWLYAGLALHVIQSEGEGRRSARLDIFELNLGLVGPSALGEDVQNGFHDLIEVAEARGWDNQIEDEPGVNLIYERRHRFSTAAARSGWGADFIPHAGFSLGNVFTYANAGAEIRLGYRLPPDFGSNLIRPSGDSGATSLPRFGVFLFGAFDARAVARDITLDGNTFKDSPDIDKEPFVADYYGGIGLSFPRLQLRYAQAYRTKEFKGQEDGQVFGSISATVLF